MNTGAASTPPKADADRKSTRLNSSHPSNSYAVFCLKKKNHRLDVSRHDDENRNTLVDYQDVDECRLELGASPCSSFGYCYVHICDLAFFFFLMIRRPPRSTLSLHDALPI